MQLLHTRAGERLAAWVAEAHASSVEEIERFAAGLLPDFSAIQAGFTVGAWSQWHAYCYGARGFDQALTIVAGKPDSLGALATRAVSSRSTCCTS